MRQRLPRIEARPVRTVPPLFEKQKQQRSGHWRHLFDDDLGEPVQHIFWANCFQLFFGPIFQLSLGYFSIIFGLFFNYLSGLDGCKLRH